MKKKTKLFAYLTIGLLLCGCSNTPSSSNSQNSESETSSLGTSNELPNSSLSSEKNTSTSSNNVTTSNNDTSSLKPIVDNAITNYGTYGEGMFFEFKETNASKVKVEYKLINESTYQVVDKELIRQKDSSSVRVEILGMKNGTYDIKITSSLGQNIELKNITITNYDRSGYAHFNVNNAIGGYNNDGSVKNNATIVYVNDSNKNTVTAKIGSKNCTGLAEILKAQSASSNPLIVRIIGSINAATWNPITYKKGSSNLTDSQILDKNGNPMPKQAMQEDEVIKGGYNTLDTSKYTKLNGLTNKVSYKSGKGFDSYFNMLDISGAKNVTLEGVGSDAKIFQWGITWKSCSYIEVRNLTFDAYTEDACAFEGAEDSQTLDGFTTGHIWVHNNQFNMGKNYWDLTPEQDKHEGDGATDLKKLAYVTFSYNHYIKNHKTGLVGGGDTQYTAAITYHHNFYDQCSSRLPLARQANMHMYNNYYYKTSNTSMSLRANAYAFVEGCLFEGGKNPMETQSGAVIKSFNNKTSGTSGKNNSTTVTKREQTVSNSNVYDKNFDTNSNNFYYDSVNKVSDVSYLTDPDTAKQDVKAYAGPLHINPLSKQSSTQTPSPTPTPEDPLPELSGEKEVFDIVGLNKDGQITSSFSSGIFKVTATTTANQFIDIANGINYYSELDSTLTSEIKLRGAGQYGKYRTIEFTITKKAVLTIYARSANKDDARQLGVYKSNGTAIKEFDPILSATKLTCTLDAGTYYISCVSSGVNVGGVILNYTK